MSRFLILTLAVVVIAADTTRAGQTPAMPDPAVMSGVPLAVNDSPDRSISVRVVKGTLTAPVPNVKVVLKGDGPAIEATTDREGRAHFSNVAAGRSVQASATVAGEELVSQRFVVPARGGTRLLLAGGVSSRPVTAAPAPSMPGVGPPLLSTVPVVQGQMPIPAQMAGLPLQVGDLPPGTVAVRLLRERFGNDVTGHSVELHVGEGGRILTAATGTDGRAVFGGLAVGENVHAIAQVDGEKLESQTFTLPSRGGVRVMLVAGVGAGVPSDTQATGSARVAEAVAAPSVKWNGIRVAFAALLAGGAGLVLLAGWRKKGDVRPTAAARTSDASGQPDRDREDLFARLIALEDEWEARRIAERDYRRQREVLLQRVEKLDRA